MTNTITTRKLASTSKTTWILWTTHIASDTLAATMHSPLPDSSALEAGIIEDARPSRLYLVQDNVRNLLRSSVFGSVHSSPVISPTYAQQTSRPIIAPLRSPVLPNTPPTAVPSPTETISTTTSASSLADTQDIPGVLFPPVSYHQSTLFNTRAVAALDHPDLSDPSLAVLLQQKTEKRQRRAWKRHRTRRSKSRSNDTQWIVCLLLGFVLAGLIGTCKLKSPSHLRTRQLILIR